MGDENVPQMAPLARNKLSSIHTAKRTAVTKAFSSLALALKPNELLDLEALYSAVASMQARKSTKNAPEFPKNHDLRVSCQSYNP
jgi:hypothetical protein